MKTPSLKTTPRADGFRMPAEWEPHARTWMVWPERADNWRLNAAPAQAAYAAVARAIARFEAVTVCASAARLSNARTVFQDTPICVVEMTTDDAWVRDTGPTFVTNNQGEVRGIDWEFNAWGGLNGGLYSPWANDDRVAAKILEIECLPRYRTIGFVLEGGSIHVDGEGTVITTEECLLNKNRNPHMTRPAIEETLHQYLNIEKVIWLPQGLFNDETDGHVDNFCCYVRPGEVLLAWTEDKSDPNYRRCQAAMRVLENAADAKGRKLIIHKMPIPGPLYASADECAGVAHVAGTQPRNPSVRLAGSYVNFLIVNGGIIAPAFGDPNDAEAESILKKCFPQHEVVMMSGREILLGGGNIHCITQQQPAITPRSNNPSRTRVSNN